MNRDDIINVLIERGYAAEGHDVTKNGVIFKGILIQDKPAICPVIYTEKIIRDSSSLEEAVDTVIDIYESNKEFGAQIIIDDLNDPEWILDHITIGLQKTSDEGLVKRPCDLEGLEKYLILSGGNSADGCYSIKVTPALLSNVCIDEALAWNIAIEHLCNDTQIVSLGKVMADMMGTPYDSSMDAEAKFHVITNSQKYKGAACILNWKALRTFTQSYDTNMLFVIPSSIHEMMIAPYDSRFKLEELSAMVKEINETQVAPEERLTDRAYILSL